MYLVPNGGNVLVIVTCDVAVQMVPKTVAKNSTCFFIIIKFKMYAQIFIEILKIEIRKMSYLSKTQINQLQV